MINIAEHGDRLEREYADFIKEKLPVYELIWQRYIGHDGRGHYLSLPNLAPEQKEKRDKFCQYHYTCLESAVCLLNIVETSNNQKNDCMETYIGIINNLLAYHAHMGRIRDCVKKMGELFKMRNLHDGFDDFYKQRNQVLHDRKLPMFELEGEIAIAVPEGNKPDDGKWNDQKTWDDVTLNDAAFLSSYLNETFDKLIPVLNASLYKIFALVKQDTEKYDINIEAQMGNNDDFLSSFSPPLSGYSSS